MSPAAWIGVAWTWLRLRAIEKREQMGIPITPSEWEWIAKREQKYRSYR